MKEVKLSGTSQVTLTSYFGKIPLCAILARYYLIQSSLR